MVSKNTCLPSEISKESFLSTPTDANVFLQSFSIFYKDLFHLFQKETHRGRVTETGKFCINPLLHKWLQQLDPGQVEPEAPTDVSPGGWSPNAWVPFYCLPRHIGGKQDWK